MAFPSRPPRLEPASLPPRFGGPAGATVQVLDDLSVANRYFGGIRSVFGPLRRLLAHHRSETVRLLDMGCGRGDAPRALVGWARSHGLDLRVVGVDRDHEVVVEAQAACRPFPEIRIVQADARHLPFRPAGFDYVFLSMLLHYFSSDEARGLLRAWAALASHAVVVNDVERHWFPCLAISLLGRISTRGLFREGSRRTVLRGFTPQELATLATEAGLTGSRVQRYFPHRLTLVGWRDASTTRGPASPASPRR